MSKKLLFTFAAIQAVGAGFSVLQFFGVRWTGLGGLVLMSSGWLAIAAILILGSLGFSLYGFFRTASATPERQLPAPAATSAAPGGGQFQDIEAFYRTYDNALLREFEVDIRTRSNAYAPGDVRERFLTRLSATTLVIGMFEIVWLTIYRSQIMALEALNTRPHPVNELQPYYDEAAAQYPDLYANYSFHAWLAFIRGWLLIFELGDSIQISLRGREFLKWLLEQGHSANGRLY